MTQQEIRRETAAPLASAGGDDPDRAERLTLRIEQLESERRRSFRDTQDEADIVFAQYQLSQLLSSGDTLANLASAVLVELTRASGATGGALWLADTEGGRLRLIGLRQDAAPDRDGTPGLETPPSTFADLSSAAAWADAVGWTGVVLEESRDIGAHGFVHRSVGLLALSPAADADRQRQARLLTLVRHELAIALRSAQLRATLERERAILLAILDGASDAIVAVDDHRLVVRHNPAAVALLGIGDRGDGLSCCEFLGCGIDGSCGPDEANDEGPGAPRGCGPRCPFAEVLETGTAIALREQTLTDRRGVQIPVAASYARMPGPEVGAVAVIRDLRAARAVDELKSSFVAAVSHELRTPLALISGYAQSLLALPLEEEERRTFVERIDQTADRLNGFVNQLLDLGAVESDRLGIEPRPMALSTVLASVIDELSEMPGTLPVGLTVAHDLPPVYLDPARIGQVVLNLIDNARKYGEPGSVVTISAQRQGGSAVVSIENDGLPIPVEERELVFDRFYRGRAARGVTSSGAGLGLYLCRRLVEAHGGRIWLADRTDGTTVSFSLPLATEGQRPSQDPPSGGGPLWFPRFPRLPRLGRSRGRR